VNDSKNNRKIFSRRRAGNFNEISGTFTKLSIKLSKSPSQFCNENFDDFLKIYVRLLNYLKVAVLPVEVVYPLRAGMCLFMEWSSRSLIPSWPSDTSSSYLEAVRSFPGHRNYSKECGEKYRKSEYCTCRLRDLAEMWIISSRDVDEIYSRVVNEIYSRVVDEI
jgi:hypothetical protein